MDETNPIDEDLADVTERLDFLLATRVRYELLGRPDRVSAQIAAPPLSGDEPVDPEQKLRAAEFLLATRVLRETNERVIQQGHPAASSAPETPP